MHWEPETTALHSGQELEIATRSWIVPTYQTTSDLFKDMEDTAATGVRPVFVRLTICIKHIKDLLSDLSQALTN